MRQLHHLSGSVAMIVASICINVGADDSFPVAAPADVGLSADAIAALADHVAEVVENEDVVGAELQIIKDRKTVFRRAYGWEDREAKRALQTGAIYCVRSMTKPLVGTAVQMLLDEGKLSLD